MLVQYDQLVPSLIGDNDSIKDGERTVDKSDMDRYVVAAFERHLITNKTDDKGKRIINRENVESLYDMIDLCREINATPILITTLTSAG